MEELLSNNIIIGVVSSMISASLMFWGRYVYLQFLDNKLMKNDTLIMEQKITVYTKFMQTLKVNIEENSIPRYVYKGSLKIIEDTIYGNMTGVGHPAKSFLVLKMPFNRKDKVPILIGVFTGITQNKQPASVVVCWSREKKTKREIKQELGKKKKQIIVENYGDENKIRTIIDQNLHV